MYHMLRFCGSTAISAMRPERKDAGNVAYRESADQIGGKPRRGALLSDQQVRCERTAMGIAQREARFMCVLALSISRGLDQNMARALMRGSVQTFRKTTLSR